MRQSLALAIAALIGASSPAFAADTATAAATTSSASTTDDAAIRRLIAAINPDSKVKSIHDSPLPGFKTVVADGTVLYVTNDARYVMYGVLLDTKEQRNLTDGYLAEAHIDLLESIPAKSKLSFKPKDPKYTVTVFTDITCGYCQALHKQIQSYLDVGIQVDYVPWPREGKGSGTAAHMKDVWCSRKPQQAFTDAIGGKLPDATSKCAASEEFDKVADIGEKLQIEGTPTVYDAHGNKLGGYATAQAMLTKLQQGVHVTRATASK